MPKLRTIQFQTPTLSSEAGGFLGLGKKWTTRNQSAQATQFSEALGNGIDLPMVKIPGGQFWMGSPDGEGYDDEDEKPQHAVEVPEFWLGQYAVTQAQWAQVAAYPKVAIDLEPFPAYYKGENRPVEKVNWDQAVEFCQRLSRHPGRSYRLPSEAEWEYACRAGTTTPFHVGPTITPDLANYRGDSTYGGGPKGVYREQTTDVGSFPPNAFGLYDMHGNVWEWCQDVWHGNYEGAPADGSAWMVGGAQDRHVLRGGSWADYPDYCRSALRFAYARANFFHYVGFRVVCVPA